jgi:hypothetical protein
VSEGGTITTVGKGGTFYQTERHILLKLGQVHQPMICIARRTDTRIQGLSGEERGRHLPMKAKMERKIPMGEAPACAGSRPSGPGEARRPLSAEESPHSARELRHWGIRTSPAKSPGNGEEAEEDQSPDDEWISLTPAINER